MSATKQSAVANTCRYAEVWRGHLPRRCRMCVCRCGRCRAAYAQSNTMARRRSPWASRFADWLLACATMKCALCMQCRALRLVNQPRMGVCDAPSCMHLCSYRQPSRTSSQTTSKWSLLKAETVCRGCCHTHFGPSVDFASAIG